MSEEETFHVLVTAFGSSPNHKENAAWLAVEPLHDTVIELEKRLTEAERMSMIEEDLDIPKTRIHISALQVPMIYESVLDMVPGLYYRPPVLPPTVRDDPTFPAAPQNGYDLIFHIGVAGRGPLRVEKAGHKLGYQMKDAEGKLAPLVESPVQDFGRSRDGFLGAVNMEIMAMDTTVDPPTEGTLRLNRGFGARYEKFPEELYTDIEVTSLVHELKQQGVEQIYTSMDAGHYVCDFLYYCSLAESRRSVYEKGRGYSYEKGRKTHVLFMHCPPVNQPLSAMEVTEAIRRIMACLARRL